MKKLQIFFATVLLALVIISCNNSDMPVTSENQDKNIPDNKGINIASVPDPVFVYFKQEVVRRVDVTNMYVMNQDGSNRTNVLSISPSETWVHRQWECPKWIPGRNTIYFAKRGDNYTWNGKTYNANGIWLCDIIIETNRKGVQTVKATNTRKLWDGASIYTTHYNRAWNPNLTSNEVAVTAFYQPSSTWKIMIIPGDGNGTPTTIYTEEEGYTTHWLTFSPDGNYIAFTRTTQNNKYIRIIERYSGNVVKDIDLSQFSYIGKLEWQRTLGSPIIAFNGKLGGIDNMYAVDASSDSPAALIINNGTSSGMGTWSPDDSNMLYTDLTNQWGLRIYNFNTGTTSNAFDTYAEFSNWRK